MSEVLGEKTEKRTRRSGRLFDLYFSLNDVEVVLLEDSRKIDSVALITKEHNQLIKPHVMMVMMMMVMMMMMMMMMMMIMMMMVMVVMMIMMMMMMMMMMMLMIM